MIRVIGSHQFVVGRVGCALGLLCVIAVEASSQAQQTPTPPLRKLTLPQLVEIARARAPQVILAEAQVAVRKTQQTEASRSWAPFGDLTFGELNVHCGSGDLYNVADD